MYMDNIIKQNEIEVKRTFIGYKHLKPVTISEGIFADDLVLIAETKEQLQNNINIWNMNLKKSGMTIKKTKTKVMTLGKKEDIVIEIEGTQIEQVDQYKYLGVEISTDGTNTKEISTRIEKALKVYFNMRNVFINKKEISKNTKISIFKSIYRPVLLYGCETWTLNQQDKSRIQAAEMKYLRRVAGFTKLDRQRNDDIRKSLEVEPINAVIEKRQLGWWGHLVRMPNTRLVRNVWEAKDGRRRKRGRPRLEWNSVIAEILRKREIDIVQAKKLAENRKEWKNWIEL